MKPKTKGLFCEKERACQTCLDRLSQNKTSSKDNKILKRKPANEYHRMLPYYLGEYKPQQNNV